MPLIDRLTPPQRPEPLLIDPAEVPHADANGPADVSAPPAIGPAPGFEGAVVPGVVDEDLDQPGRGDDDVQFPGRSCA